MPAEITKVHCPVQDSVESVLDRTFDGRAVFPVSCIRAPVIVGSTMILQRPNELAASKVYPPSPEQIVVLTAAPLS